MYESVCRYGTVVLCAGCLRCKLQWALSWSFVGFFGGPLIFLAGISILYFLVWGLGALKNLVIGHRPLFIDCVRSFKTWVVGHRLQVGSAHRPIVNFHEL
jgi:hypothetical protein